MIAEMVQMNISVSPKLASLMNLDAAMANVLKTICVATDNMIAEMALMKGIVLQRHVKQISSVAMMVSV